MMLVQRYEWSDTPLEAGLRLAAAHFSTPDGSCRPPFPISLFATSPHVPKSRDMRMEV